MKILKPEEAIREALQQALKKSFSMAEPPEILIEKPRQAAFGDFATTLALGLAKTLKAAPRTIAEKIVENLQDDRHLFENVSVAGPGFINFTLSPSFWQQQLQAIRAMGDRFGEADWGAGEKVQVEFVSANPTGPLNVVSARAAAVGDVMVSLMKKVGFAAQREYYVNDAGRQIRLLGASVSARYMALCGQQEPMPEEGYHGDYIVDLAREIKDEYGEKFVSISREERANEFAKLALERMIALHQKTMAQYRVNFDCWYRESELRQAGKHLQILQQLETKGYTYKKDGAVWFTSTQFGDEKDRVLVTREGEPTYFLVDIAYHEDKYARGFSKLYDLWGPDHHGYIPRMSAAMQALGHPKESFQVRIIQQVNMLRGGQVVKMSKRKGNIIEMQEVVDEVGVDAARFFFIMRKLDSPLDFDIDLAKKQTEENPVYYVQYAHARVVNILQFAREKGLDVQPEADLSLLVEKEELAVIKRLAEYPEMISKAAKFLEPHRVTTYLMDLASTFHSFYQKHRVVTEDRPLSLARLQLVDATRQVLKNALDLLKITAPQRM